MKKLILIIGTLLLTGCAGGPEIAYVPDHDRFVEIKTELRDCMQRAVDTPYYGLERLRVEVQGCDDTAFHQLRFKLHPESFYVDDIVDDPYEDFSFCSSYLASGMWDFPPEATTAGFRENIQGCINSFPAL